MRKSGILMPITSLPSKYGIGCFSKEAYEFIDFLENAEQKYWQILPLGTTSFGDSPYQSFSTFAGNAYFIDLETLIGENLITTEECDQCDFGNDPRYIDYGKIYNSRYIILKKAFEKSNHEETEEYKIFLDQNLYWLEDFSLYMAIKSHNNQVSWFKWNDDIRLREKEAMNKYKSLLAYDIEFWNFLQYKFYEQWYKLKEYANSKGIKIIGDIPIYVAADSADCWSNPELFLFDESLNMKEIAGCPPDAFSDIGQLWGNPLYDWNYHKKTDYNWWLSRLSHSLNIHDTIRIDHFRGFDEYFSIPYGDKTAFDGKWNKGPGLDLFKKVKEKLGNLDIIAEDLGFLTDTVKQLLADTGFPGMKVIEFAFDSREASDYLPHNYDKNCVVYTGTHDNETLKQWYDAIIEEDKNLSLEYLNNYNTPPEEIHWDFIRLAMQSVANLCVIPIQDYLGYGKEARMNVPSTIGNNWKWRIIDSDITEELTEKISKITTIYGRN